MNQNVHRNLRGRKLRASLRDTRLLLRQFAAPLVAFCIAIVGGGTIYYLLSLKAGETLINPAEGMYVVLGLTFLQPLNEFPHAWYLEIFYFLMPVIGIGILAQGVADFGILFFNRRSRGKEWEVAVASTFNHHIILVGLGHLGFRVVRDLYQMGQDVVVLERDPSKELVSSVKQMNLPVIQGDASRETILKEGGIENASAIVLCTQNDSLNLQIALKARNLNPNIHVIVRIFDGEFAQALHDQFGFTAMSATGMAAPAFAAAAAGIDMTPPITIEGESLSLARINVASRSPLIGKSVGEIEADYDLSVVLLHHLDEHDFHPAASRCLEPGDLLAILGGPIQINKLMQNNIPS
jgi:voltage-gated potassium channel